MLLGFAMFNSFRMAGTFSSDLMATWLAGYFYDLGQLDLVYPSDTSLYTVTAPSDWPDLVRSFGFDDEVFPFVYPPLWAAVVAPVTRFLDVAQFQSIASFVNGGLLVALFWLGGVAARLSGRDLILAVLVGMGFALTTWVGDIALRENQPQILVSMLIVAALVGLDRRNDGLAGAMLALAAAIKLYPALFLVILLVMRRWQAVKGFVIAGALLAGASVWLTGWSLHQEFLTQIGIMSRTVILSPLIYTSDGVWAAIFHWDALQAAAASGDTGGWLAIAKTGVWSWISRGLLIALALGAGLALRSGRPALAVWGAFLVLLGLFGPLSWSYHYLTPLAVLVPALWHNAPRQSLWFAVLSFASLSMNIQEWVFSATESRFALFYVGTCGIALMAATFISLAFAETKPKNG